MAGESSAIPRVFPPGTTSYEYEVSEAEDVRAVRDWAEAEKGDRAYVVSLRVDHDEGLGLVRLAGWEPASGD